MVTHEEKLIKKIKDLQDRLEKLGRKQVYKEKNEEDMRDIIETLYIIVANNPIFNKFMGLVLPKKLSPDWFEEEMYEDEDEAFVVLKDLIKKSERSCNQLLTHIETLPKEKKEKKVSKEPIKDVKAKEPKKKSDEKPSIGYIKLPIPFTDIKIKINRRELGIFLLGIVVGIIILISAILGINFISGL